MKHLDVKNKKSRQLTKEFEKIKLILKTIIKNRNLFNLIRWKALNKIKILPKKSSKTLFTNRCILSRRKKRLNKVINVSRLVFLNFARMTEICDIQKAVW